MKRVTIKLPSSSGFVQMSEGHIFFAARQAVDNEVCHTLADYEKLDFSAIARLGIKVILDDKELETSKALALIEESKRLGFTLLINRKKPQLITKADFSAITL